MKTLFHLAFPVHDLQQAKEFYQKKLGFKLGRESAHAAIFQFGGHQIVAQLTDSLIPDQKGIYPRHFGLIFLDEKSFYHFIKELKVQKIPFEIPPKTRFANTAIEHQCLFLKDPSNNLLEFKYYKKPSAIFNETDYKDIGEH